MSKILAFFRSRGVLCPLPQISSPNHRLKVAIGSIVCTFGCIFMGCKFIKNNTEYIDKKIDDWEDVFFAGSITTFACGGVVSIPFYVANSLKDIKEARTTCSVILRSSCYFTGGLLLTSVTAILCLATICVTIPFYYDKIKTPNK